MALNAIQSTNRSINQSISLFVFPSWLYFWYIFLSCSNSIPATTSLQALRTKLQVAERKCHVDVGFWGGIVPDNQVLNHVIDTLGPSILTLLLRIFTTQSRPLMILSKKKKKISKIVIKEEKTTVN